MSQKQQTVGKYYAQKRRERKKEKMFEEEYALLAYGIYQEMDTHTHSDPTGKQAMNSMKWRSLKNGNKY